jgi:hypothetical protein
VASSAQTLPLQDEILQEMVPRVPVVSAVAEAQEKFRMLVPAGQVGVLDDPESTALGLCRKLKITNDLKLKSHGVS